ncbi:MAG: LuxR C-terminal-related transcriptional regulator, partial [Fidelibacterota bacterium]
IALLDISLPGISGIELCKQILNQFPDTCVLMLTMHKSDEFLKESLKAGASGFLLKHSAVGELTTAIRAVCDGKKYISADLTEGVINKLFTEDTGAEYSESELTSKEKEIVRLVAQGWENQQIAEALHISVSTAKTHRANIMKKLGFHKNVDLVKYAIKTKLIELD